MNQEVDARRGIPEVDQTRRPTERAHRGRIPPLLLSQICIRIGRTRSPHTAAIYMASTQHAAVRFLPSKQLGLISWSSLHYADCTTIFLALDRARLKLTTFLVIRA